MSRKRAKADAGEVIDLMQRLQDSLNATACWRCIQCHVSHDSADMLTMHAANTGHQTFFGTKADLEHHRRSVGGEERDVSAEPFEVTQEHVAALRSVVTKATTCVYEHHGNVYPAAIRELAIVMDMADALEAGSTISVRRPNHLNTDNNK